MKKNSYLKAMLTKDLILSSIGLILGIAITSGIIKSDILIAIFYTLEIGILLDVIIYLTKKEK